MRTLVVAFLVSACAGVSSAQERVEPVESVFVTGETVFLQPGHAGIAGIDWVRKLDQRGVLAGVQSGSRADAWWTYGRVGGFTRWNRALFSGTLDAGGGRQLGAPFGYRKVTLQTSLLLASGHVVVQTEGQAARLANEAFRLARFGVEWRPTPAATASVSYYVLSLEHVLTPALSMRFDVSRGRTSWIGGTVFARRDGPTSLVGQIGPHLANTQVFGGGGFRAGRYRLQIVGTLARSSTESSRLTASLQIPIERRKRWHE